MNNKKIFISLFIISMILIIGLVWFVIIKPTKMAHDEIVENYKNYELFIKNNNNVNNNAKINECGSSTFLILENKQKMGCNILMGYQTNENIFSPINIKEGPTEFVIGDKHYCKKDFTSNEDLFDICVNENSKHDSLVIQIGK